MCKTRFTQRDKIRKIAVTAVFLFSACQREEKHVYLLSILHVIDRDRCVVEEPIKQNCVDVYSKKIMKIISVLPHQTKLLWWYV
jgi:hypothetical protein